MAGSYKKLCPICGGKGKVQAGFYDPSLSQQAYKHAVHCRKCKGEGWLPNKLKDRDPSEKLKLTT